MKNLTTNEIRNLWIEFYREKGHHIEDSKSLVPFEDDSLLFINSGVATLKKYFDGSETPISPRISNSQKVIRTNDIENVGVTSRHHTLFEMLGNFSIGDYFKQEAITWAYELLTSPKWFAFDIEKLYFTIHPNDQDAYDTWINLGVKPDKIIKLEENFWEIGPGPGGPNTEIFYDRGEAYDDRNVHDLLAQDLENDRIIEIWNIVFSQYNCNPGVVPISEYKELPQKNIDTGMGLERMACVMQEVESNFETDNFMAIINKLESITNIKYADEKMAYRVISDHIRALTFSIADGVLPSNEGRGYVIRRILRRAARFGYNNLGQRESFLPQLVDTVIEKMSEFYPYLINSRDFICEVVEMEEKKFLSTLEDGLKLLNKEIEVMAGSVLSGDVAFKLYDTYGFPIELTQEVLAEKNYTVCIEEFNSNLEAQRQRARAAINTSAGMSIQNSYLKEISSESKFIGYDHHKSESTVILITDLNYEFEELSSQACYVLLDKTPFYAISGGQVSDFGYINGNKVIEVIKLPNGQHLHKLDVHNIFKKQDIVKACIDEEFRLKVTQNHSATHLLHLALHKVVGKHALQAGSLQDDIKTRFDFSNLKALTNEQLIEIMNLVNKDIKSNLEINIKTMGIEDAKILGANALFGDKYGDIVRVVTMGESIELCGGTHLKNTCEIDAFQIVSETGIGSGVRRIEAVTGISAIKYRLELKNEFDNVISEINIQHEKSQVVNLRELDILMSKLDMLYVKFSDVKEIYENIVLKNKQIKKANIELNNKNSVDIVNTLIDKIIVVDGVNKIEATLEDVEVKELKAMADDITNQVKSCIVILKVQDKDKVSVVVSVTKDLTDQYQAGNIIKEIIEPFGGRGGGKPTMAQGGYQI